jgi:hypothetical protein
MTLLHDWHEIVDVDFTGELYRFYQEPQCASVLLNGPNFSQRLSVGASFRPDRPAWQRALRRGARRTVGSIDGRHYHQAARSRYILGCDLNERAAREVRLDQWKVQCQ